MTFPLHQDGREQVLKVTKILQKFNMQTSVVITSPHTKTSRRDGPPQASLDNSNYSRCHVARPIFMVIVLHGNMRQVYADGEG